MELLDMPPEIFQRVVKTYVRTNGVVEAWKIRKTCKTFRDYVEYEIFSTPKLNGYIKEKAGRNILRNNIAKFLYLRSNKLNGFIRDLVPNFIRDVMAIAEPWVRDDKAKAALRKVLCELYVKTDSNAFACIVQDIRHGRHQNHLQGFQVTKVINLVAAAAAAGSPDWLRDLANHDHQVLWLHSPTFGYPIVAAAYAGQFNVVKALAEQALTDQGLSTTTSATAKHTSFREAICTSIKVGHDEMATVLIQKYDEAFGPASETCMTEWLQCSVSTGNKVITRLLQRIPTHAGTYTFYTAFENSCRLRDPGLIRIFFEEGRLEVNGISSYSYPLTVASQMSHTSTVPVEVLLSLGANPDGPTYRGHFRRPLEVALQTGRDRVAILLLEAGANIHLISKSCWKPYMKQWSGMEEVTEALNRSLRESQKPRPLCGELFVCGNTGGDEQ
ncbi:hypothetical protein P3342_003869 [Pyrenophora teres f. teres]|nr:hypothetical protein P3342_003869 [Pyrenophora teres f. teres]